jgi:hypothetical protein
LGCFMTIGYIFSGFGYHARRQIWQPCWSSLYAKVLLLWKEYWKNSSHLTSLFTRAQNSALVFRN